MLDFKTQSHLVDATAAVLRSCLMATSNAWAASTCRGLSLWAEMLGAGSPRQAPAIEPVAPASPLGMMLWPSMANWMSASQLYGWSPWPWLPGSLARTACTPFAGTWPGPSFSLWMPLGDSGAWTLESALPAVTQPTELRPSGNFASYRSAGGHAMAQTAASPIELVEPPAATLNPSHTMLGAWRSGPGVRA